MINIFCQEIFQLFSTLDDTNSVHYNIAKTNSWSELEHFNGYIEYPLFFFYLSSF